MYILNCLREIRDTKDLLVVLDETEPFKGDIEGQYYSYWIHNFDSDYDLVQLLGLLSRLRGAILGKT